MRPSSADTSEPACVKRKMLSMKSSTSLPSASRKYSATVSALNATRRRAPGGSVIWPYQRGARPGGVVRLHDAALLHLEPEVVPLARALTNPAEHGDAAVLERDVVDELHDDDGLADAGAAEE